MGEKYTVKAEIAISLTGEDIEDIIVTALNGGIGYWACLDNTRPEFDAVGKEDYLDVWTAKILMDGGTVYFLDENDRSEIYELTLPKLMNGVRQFIEKGYDRYGVFVHGTADLANFDADAADTVIQLALFDEVVFG